MFSSIRDAILDRTNRARDNQQRNEEDKNDFVIVDSPNEQASAAASHPEARVFDVRSRDNNSSESSSGSGQSESTISATSSQPDASFKAWRFMQCGLTIPCFHKSHIFESSSCVYDIANDRSQMLR